MNIVFRGTILFVIFMLSMNGCASSVSDSAFRVTGSIRDEAGVRVDDCTMGVMFEGESKVSFSQKIDGDFMNTFTVEPGDHEIRLVIQCDRSVVYESEKINIVGMAHYESPIDLGVVVVRADPVF